MPDSLSIQQIRAAKESSVFVSPDGELILWESAEGEVPIELPLKLSHYCALFCGRGEVRLNLEMSEIAVPAQKMALLSVDSVLESYSHSPDAEYCFVLISRNTLMRHILVDDNVWRLKVFASEHPLMDMPSRGWLLLKQYIALLKSNSGKELLDYDGLLMQNLLTNAICSILNVIAYNARGRLADFNRRPGYNLFMNFLKIVSAENGRCLSVGSLAERMNVSPKHLSRVVSQVSSIPPLGWINAFTLRAALQELRYSVKSVKEIASSLGFPNQSSFGSFVRKRTGKSPSAFRSAGLFNSSH
ncbi:MAG: helix-turn-helix transcriptional regulator [Candidatus Cryptobacteroides sp.]